MKYLVLKTSLLFLASLLSTSAFAGGAQIVTSGQATSVPTLSGTMLIILSLLLFVVAFRITKQKNSSAGKMFVSLLGVIALTIGGSGIKLVTETQAGIIVPTVPLTSNQSTHVGLGETSLHNQTMQSVEIISVTPDLGSICFFIGEDVCGGTSIPLGTALSVPAGDSCLISCTIQSPN